MKTNPTSTSCELRQAHWTKEEQRLFKVGYQRFGRKWSLYSKLIPTRSAKQVRSHAQKVLGKKEMSRVRCGKCEGLLKPEIPKKTRKDIGIQCDLVENSGRQEDCCPWETDFEL